jgi:CyaY protein
MSEALSEQEFDTAADRALRTLDQQINEISEGVEADLQSGILTLEFQDGMKYVVNSHRAARQIWMAAERAAWHFDYVPAEDRWVATKGGEELWTAIEAVLSRKLQRPIMLSR